MTETTPSLSLPVDVKDVKDVNRDFLTEALSINYPGIEVVTAEQAGVFWGTGTKIRLQVEYNDVGREAGVPRLMHDRDRMEHALVQLTEFGRQGPHCFLHADYHLGNLYFDPDGSAGVYDWQTFCKGHWSHDVTYFMVSTLDIADRRKWDMALLSFYLERLQFHGVEDPPDFDTAYDAFRRLIVDGLYFWMVNPVEFQAEENNCSVAPRFAVAALDHGTFDVMGK